LRQERRDVVHIHGALRDLRSVTVPIRSCRDFAQGYCDDLVLAAAYFKPNAPGRWEISSLRALSSRQLLKSEASYLAERVLLAVTTVEVVAIVRRRFFPPHVVSWSRARLWVEPVTLRLGRLEPGRAALRLTDDGSSPRLELATLVDDEATRRVLDLLGVTAG
jgi:hypothetical protein